MSQHGWELIVGFASLAIYMGLVLWARAVHIARANRVWTDSHRDELCVSLRLLRSRMPCAQSGEAGDGIDQLLASCDQRSTDPGSWRNGNGPREIGDWVVLHEAERQAVWLLGDEQVRARFERVMGQLEELPVARRTAWRLKSRDLVRAPACQLRATLVELLAEVHNARDAKYAQLASLYSKAFWLVWVALLPLAVLLLLGYGVVLVAGAVGGLISRLQRIVYAEGLPTAYGSSWVPLFCAPLLGALAAWAGLNLIALLQTLGVIDLRDLLTGPGALVVPSSGVIGLAVLLGLSERLLNRVGGEAEKVLQAPNKPAADADTVTEALPPPRDLPAGGDGQAVSLQPS
ncbi:MAG TPA: hypothetical protein VG452_07260 [Egibacteraceae bacterium]|nr:hypothetical protein [Actinomycetota bacterium]HWB71999.1 hypothetical protein [Egibacteraceae bacterium]